MMVFCTRMVAVEAGGQAEVGFGNQVKECGQYPIDDDGDGN